MHLHVCTRTLRMDDTRNEAVHVAGALFDPRKWPKPSAYPKCPVPAGHEDAVSLEKTAICALRSRSLKRFPHLSEAARTRKFRRLDAQHLRIIPSHPLHPLDSQGTAAKNEEKDPPHGPKEVHSRPRVNEPPPHPTPPRFPERP